LDQWILSKEHSGAAKKKAIIEWNQKRGEYEIFIDRTHVSWKYQR
tara:strand:+ start:690 stop:824 length:135 start_codon:yes stop_codon:yes gene_type:complete